VIGATNITRATEPATEYKPISSQYLDDPVPAPVASKAYSQIPDVMLNEWYFGTFDRKETENFLQSCGCDAFLIRFASY
jgi:hypothetical protein